MVTKTRRWEWNVIKTRVLIVCSSYSGRTFLILEKLKFVSSDGLSIRTRQPEQCTSQSITKQETRETNEVEGGLVVSDDSYVRCKSHLIKLFPEFALKI